MSLVSLIGVVVSDFDIHPGGFFNLLDRQLPNVDGSAEVSTGQRGPNKRKTSDKAGWLV